MPGMTCLYPAAFMPPRRFSAVRYSSDSWPVKALLLPDSVLALDLLPPCRAVVITFTPTSTLGTPLVHLFHGILDARSIAMLNQEPGDTAVLYRDHRGLGGLILARQEEGTDCRLRAAPTPALAGRQQAFG